MVKDPLCGMNVNEKTAKFRSECMEKHITFIAKRVRKPSIKPS